jgi:ABC-type antimicrobial peptide transport system permease subunit
MGGLLTVIPIVVRRVKANARLLIAVVVGAILAAAIMSTTAIYTDAIRDLGLKYALQEQGPDAINISISTSSQSSQPDVYQRTQKYIEDSVKRNISRIQDGAVTAFGRSATFFPTAPGAAVSEAESRPRSHFIFLTNAEDEIEVQGRLPGDGQASGERAPNLEVAVGAETAQRIGVAIGDRFDLHPFWAADLEPVHVTVVGIVSQRDPESPFWVGQTELFSQYTTSWDTIPFLVTPQTFFNAVATYLPGMVSDYMTLVYIDTSEINSRNADSVAASLQRFDTDINANVLRASVRTQLPNVLATYDEKLFFTRIPLLVLVLQISAIVLYYLFMVSTMLVERQAGEIALIKSRGGTTGQVMKIYVLEGMAIFLVAMLAGPPLAATVISFLGRTPPFTDLTGGDNLQVHLSAGAYLWAGAGALLAFVTLLVPAYIAARNTIVNQRAASARPARQAFFMRYYLDLGLAGAGGLLLYQLDRRGSLVTEGFFGEQSVDPVMLLAPAFFILTVGIVFLRLFPLVLRVLAWVVARAQGAAVLIGMWQLVRNPMHYSRLVLLLMFATAVGMFAASFGATLDSSYADRASYQSGSKWRLTDVRGIQAQGPIDSGSLTAEQLGLERGSPVFRLSASQGQTLSRLSVDVLGVDADSFSDVAYFRDDFASSSLGGLMEPLREGRPPRVGLELPADARWLGIWVNPTNMPSAFSLQMEVVDATGRYFSYQVGPDDVRQMSPGWNLLVTDLNRPGTNFSLNFPRRPNPFDSVNGPYPVSGPQAPLSVTSITLRSPTRFAAPLGSIQFGSIEATSAATLASLDATLDVQKVLFDPERASGGLPGGTTVVEFAASSADWSTLQGMLPNALNDRISATESGGFSALELSWEPQQGSINTHGLQFASIRGPIPALASRGFIEATGLKVGDVTKIFVSQVFLDVEIAGTFDLFPTLEDTRKNAALIVDGPTIGAVINGHPAGPLQYPGEIWLDGGSQDIEGVRAALQKGNFSAGLVSFEQLREAQQKDPLVAAGWEGILFISFAAILILSAIGFLIYSYLTAQRRTLEFAVLRTMGFSKRQIAGVVSFEQFFVIGLGMVAGTLMGMRLGSLMIRYMGLTETGDEVVPPMVLEISWFTVGTLWLVLGTVFLVTIGAVVLLYSRLALHRVLRIGEA